MVDAADPSPSLAGVRVLVMAEAVTLAHVGRSVALARGLAARGAVPVFAVDPRFAAICPTGRWQTETIRSLPTVRFTEALARGAPLYDLRTLRDYVAADLALLRRIEPAVVLGDFRLSLGVSARLLKVPYINVTNAYWSPYARPVWHAPALPWVPLLPARLADRVFRAARPLAFRLHAGPLEALRREHGLPSLGSDLRRVYTDGDLTLYADDPALVPVHGAPSSHRHLGPVPWSPDVPLPEWWAEIGDDDRLVYVTLGSSGDAARLPGILAGLAALGLPVVVALAGKPRPAELPSGVRVADYLPGDAVARRSALVVCNGGSPTSQQALAHGVPVLALPGNLDQFLNSSYLKAAGVAEWLRPEAATPAAVEAASRALLCRSGSIAESARRWAAAAPKSEAVLADAIAELSARAPALVPAPRR